MSNKLLFIFCFILFSFRQIYPQEGISCGVTTVFPQTQTGGYNVTSIGTVKALFIFIDFPDDTIDVNNPIWPVGTGPNFLKKIVDSTVTQNSGIYANLSTFFDDMSYGQFKMIGTAYYVQAPHALSWYIANHEDSESSYSAQDAIQILDQALDFSDYDRWVDSSYNHVLGSDGILDMVFICYRQWYLNQGNFGGSSFIAEGWYGASLPSSNITVDNGARHIVSSHAVDVLNMIQYPRFEHLVHEFGHAWGLNHQYAPGFWSIMGQRYPSNSSFMNAYEREQLGWISFHDITSSQPASLRDFGQYDDDVYRVSIGSGQYFIFENHQRNSIYDNPDLTGGKGLYIVRQYPYGLNHYQGNLKVETSDGRFNWLNPYWVPFPGNGILTPVFQKGASSRTQGQNIRDLLPATNPNTAILTYNYVIAKVDETTGQTTYSSFYKGNGKSAFNLSLNNTFSPWSNPSACNTSGALTNFAAEILATSDSVLDVQFYVGNPSSASPSNPQDIHSSFSSSTQAVTTWSANLEPRFKRLLCLPAVLLFKYRWNRTLSFRSKYNWCNFSNNLY